jgi:hypothetical protein
VTWKGWTVAAGLALLLPGMPHAATEANFGARTTGDLVALCSAPPDSALGTAADNFCEGFVEGAVAVELENMAAFRGRRLFCLPNPPPSRSEAMSQFVAWAGAAPDRLTQSSTDGLFHFLMERYPCPRR